MCCYRPTLVLQNHANLRKHVHQNNCHPSFAKACNATAVLVFLFGFVPVYTFLLSFCPDPGPLFYVSSFSSFFVLRHPTILSSLPHSPTP